MKNCKSCHKEIDQKATKCPYCQAFQTWFKNPQLLGFVFPLIFIPFIFGSTGLFSKKSYTDFSNEFSVSLVNESSDNEHDIHTYEISNNTKHKWKNISYQMKGFDDSEEIVVVDSNNNYTWIIQPNSKSMLSVRTTKNTPATHWKFEITDITSHRLF
jgi:hypothetical protein